MLTNASTDDDYSDQGNEGKMGGCIDENIDDDNDDHDDGAGPLFQ